MNEQYGNPYIPSPHFFILCQVARVLSPLCDMVEYAILTIRTKKPRLASRDGAFLLITVLPRLLFGQYSSLYLPLREHGFLHPLKPQVRVANSLLEIHVFLEGV